MIGLLGFGASHIVLTGMGGVTMNQRRARPWQNLLISLAGPVSSLLLWILCAWAAYNVAFFRTDKMFRVLIPLLAVMNLLWAKFNLIPVPPLDGGHATREFFSMFLSQRAAFIISIWIAFIGGGAIVLYLALRGQYFIAVYIAFFIFQAYQQWDYFKRHGVPGD
jgi:Zn-dependent protease